MKCQCPTPPKPYTHTLTLQKPDPNATNDDDGLIDLRNDDNWVTVASIRARFVTSGGRESERTDTETYRQVQAMDTVLVFTPATNTTRNLNPAWRLKLGTRVFQIVSAQLINETGREVTIKAMERRQP